MKMRKGFTLIELLIVLAIIAALMAVVTPIALNAVRKAKATQVAENIRNIKSAVEAYVNVEQPDSLDDLTIDGSLSSYLNTDPGDDFDLVVEDFDAGVATVTIYYVGGEVPFDELDKVLPELTEESSDNEDYPALVVEFQKWW